MKSKAGPASRELKSVADVEKFVNNFDQGILGKFPTNIGCRVIIN